MYRGMLNPQSVSFRKFSIISNRSRPSIISSRSSVLSSRPSIWSIPRLSILSRRTNSDTSNDDGVVADRHNSRNKTGSSTIDLEPVEVMPDDDVFISQPNSPERHGSHRRSQRQGSQQRGSQRKGSQCRNFRRRVTFTGVPPIPEQTEDEKDVKNCVVITNTIEVEIIDDTELTNVDEGNP